jgi:[acyl-carrier-protein] S-malonyltransferase
MLAIVFPGQGSQSVGMLADIANQFQIVQEIFTQASDALGYDLWRLVQEGPASELDQTVHTQPALLTASYAIWRLLETNQKIVPHVLAGHSLGEYTALVCAQALNFSEAVRLVAARGQYMQEAVAPGAGAMAALIGLEESKVNEICEEARQKEEVLSPANFNSIGQIVIAGHKTAVDRAIDLAKSQGAKLALLIPVSVPSHCQLMQPAAEKLAEKLDTVNIQMPRIPVINNVDAVRYTSTQMIREGLGRQLVSPVRWVETIHNFIKMGVDTVIECGPGKVLTGLNKRIDKVLELKTTADLDNLQMLLK